MVQIDLSGYLQFQHAGEDIYCVVRGIAEDCTEIIITSFDKRICTQRNVYMNILLPVERSPIRFYGKLSEDKVLFDDRKGYSARIDITEIGRIDRRRLELVAIQRRAIMSVGKGVYAVV